ncbi:hypothetical protein FIV42_25455 [Persicimonas caeni]|uniref:Glycerophosphoryl diester phosphodiesterase membrane domain-containing protein n=1 Tax=Persicimonas caeni TaxID=2292766 RepID=A0A4Y6Q067_PERCE|nr:hypothetical protein [Persicimonas caeni]QDG53966.1 hypothetical protein FIV42_25455 [Persicimonas caeni]QED35187.1 hypothetical protein FRD00_25450 [Persicimonas caeni]
MSNGNDWNGGNNDWGQSSNQPAGGPEQNQQMVHQGGGTDGGSYGAGGSGFEPPGGGPPLDAVTEGWGGGHEVTLDEVVDRLKLVANRAMGPVLKAWLAVGAVILVFNMLDAFLGIINYFVDSVAVSGAIGIVSMILGIVALVVSIAAGALQFAMFKPLHRVVFEGEHVYSGPMDVINEAKGPFVAIVILTVAITFLFGLGAACCLVPGLFIAFVFSQAPYIAATQDVDPMEAAKRSFVLNKTYWMPVLIAIGALVIIGAFASCFVGAGTFVVGLASSFLYPFSLVIIAGVYWLFTQLAMFGIFLVHMALFSTLETKETGKEPA